ncbi:hypothetical protein H0H93_002336, partial [Arthromyces matolae]
QRHPLLSPLFLNPRLLVLPFRHKPGARQACLVLPKLPLLPINLFLPFLFPKLLLPRLTCLWRFLLVSALVILFPNLLLVPMTSKTTLLRQGFIKGLWKLLPRKLMMMPTLLVPSSRRLGAKVLSVQLHLSTPLSLKLNLLLLPLLNFPTWTSNAKLSSLNLLRLLHLSSVKSTLLPTSLTTI